MLVTSAGFVKNWQEPSRVARSDHIVAKMAIDKPLKFLHAESALSTVKLNQFRAMETPYLIESLRPGQPAALKTRTDGTVLDGHHRLVVLRERGVDIDALPRERLPRGQEG